MWWIVLFPLHLVVLPVFADSRPPCQSFYTAAVLELEDRSTEEALTLIQEHAEMAREAGVQLLVLPEYGLLSSRLLLHPHPRPLLSQLAQQLPLRQPNNLAHPESPESHQYNKQHGGRETNYSCTGGAPTLLDKLSRIARSNSFYLVANLIERERCDHRTNPNCPKDRQFLYNTNVVFDRHGVIVQHYRKFNLFGLELDILDRESEASHAIFHTDFGVTFGIFTCFDILFENPATQLARAGVKHFVFPTAWMDETPSLSALQTHSGWARGLGVTLLTANQRNLNIGGVGSGVFGPFGPINYTFDTETPQKDTLVIAEVPVDCSHENEIKYTNQNRYGIEENLEDHCGKDEVNENSMESDDIVEQDLGQSSFSSENYDKLHNNENNTYNPIEIEEKLEEERTPGYDSAPNKIRYNPKHYNTSEFISKSLSKNESRAKVCHKEVCCFFRSNTAFNETIEVPNTARLVVYSGHRNFKPEFSSEICAIMSTEHASGSQNELDSDGNGSRSAKGVSLSPFRLCTGVTTKSVVYPSIQISTGMLTKHRWHYSENKVILIPEFTLPSSYMDTVAPDYPPSEPPVVTRTASDYTSSDSGMKWACITVTESLHEVAMVQMYARDPVGDRP